MCSTLPFSHELDQAFVPRLDTNCIRPSQMGWSSSYRTNAMRSF